MASRSRTLSREPPRAVAENDENLEDEDDEKVSVPKSKSVSSTLVVLAFLAGSTAAYIFLETLSSYKPPSRPPANYEVSETLNLLSTLDLDRYSELVLQKHITLKQLVAQPSGTVIDGFTPHHFWNLASEARKVLTLGAKPRDPADAEVKDDDAGVTEQASGKRSSDETTVEESLASGSTPILPKTEPPSSASTDPPAKDEPPPPPLPPKTRFPRAAKPLIPSLPRSSTGAGGYSPRPRTLPPQPTFSPPPTIPAVCHAWQRTAALKAMLRTTQPFNTQPVDGVGDPQACTEVPSQELTTTPITPQDLSSKHPIASASANAPFTNAGLSPAQVQELRVRGVAEQFYVDHELKILYCVIPKAGCSSYKRWMLDNAGLFKGGTVHKRDLYKGPRVVNGQFLSNEALREILNGGEYFKFTVTRSPYTRSLATYLERYESCESERSKSECDMWRRALSDGDSPVPRDDITFVQYLETIKAHKPAIVDFRNAHWVPGVQVCGLDHIAYDWVSRLEDPADAEMLYALVGEQPLSKKPINVRDTNEKLKKYLSEEAHRLVDELYETDISRVGYRLQNLDSSS